MTKRNIFGNVKLHLEKKSAFKARVNLMLAFN